MPWYYMLDTVEKPLRKLDYQGPFSLTDDAYGNLLVVGHQDPKPIVVRLHYPNE
jgi:hypothetical protein